MFYSCHYQEYRDGVGPSSKGEESRLARCKSAMNCFLLQQKSTLVLPFWYRITRVVPEKGPLSGCMFDGSADHLRLEVGLPLVVILWCVQTLLFAVDILNIVR